MNPVILSDRLTLLPLAESDVDIVLVLFTDPVIQQFAGGAMEEAVVRESMPIWVRRGGDGCIGVWCITNSESGEKLGSVALLPLPIEEDDTDWDLVVPGEMPDADIEVGYFLKKTAWGKGYATEACKRIIQFAFEESPLDEVVATFEAENHASRNVLIKSGFVDRGMRLCYGEDSIDFRVTRKDWEQSRHSSS